jgi:type I restriction enzyme M protein
MANENPKVDLAYADTLWKAADQLRGQIDAAEYKHVVLGLLFLKYISDAFEARRDELKSELEAEGISGQQLEGLLENRDEYIAERVFWVPPESRWSNLQNQATRPEVATLIDDAILAVERDNPNLKGKLPRDYARRAWLRIAPCRPAPATGPTMARCNPRSGHFLGTELQLPVADGESG